MNIRAVVRRLSAVISGVLAVFGAVLLTLPGLAKASTYGSGGFGDCKYQDGCPVASASTTSNQTANSTSSVTDDGITTILLNGYSEFFSATGKTLSDLEVGDIIEFCIGASSIYQACDSTKDTYHTATIKSINLASNTVVITIASTPVDYSLALNTVQKLDIDDDSTDDIEITLVALTATTANITFKNLAVVTPKIAASDNTTDDSATVAEEKGSLGWLWWLLGIVGGLILLWVLFAVLKRKDDDNNSSFGSGSSHKSSAGSGKSGGTSSSNFTPTSYAPDSYIPPTPTTTPPATNSWYDSNSNSPATH